MSVNKVDAYISIPADRDNLLYLYTVLQDYFLISLFLRDYRFFSPRQNSHVVHSLCGLHDFETKK